MLVFHLLDPKELTLDFNEQIIFEDLEDNEKIETEPWLISNSYKEDIIFVSRGDSTLRGHNFLEPNIFET